MSGQKLMRGQRLAILGSAAVAVLGAPALLEAHPYPDKLNDGTSVHWFADWEVNTNPAPTDFFVTPFLRNSTVSSVKAQMFASKSAGRPLGIKISDPTLTSASALSIFNTNFGSSSSHRTVSYIFLDFESAGSLNRTSSNLDKTKQVVKWKNTGSMTGRAYVGEFALTPLSGIGFNYTGTGGQDPTRRGSVGSMYTKADYNATGVNMANTDLYPGAANYRNKSTNDWANANIRTGLFVGPIGRMTAVQNVLNTSYNGLSKSIQNDDSFGYGYGLNPPQYHKQIPWVTRFNNWNNPSLDNGNLPGAQFVFKPGTALGSLTAAQTANQMLGRGDFSAQILHYRMRGAYSVNLFEPGVVGYTKAQMQDDVRLGWYGGGSTPNANIAHVNQIFAKSDSKAATMTLNPVIDGTSLGSGIRSENSGTIWSGEYSVSLKKLDILASNLDTVNHMIRFGDVDAYKVFTLKNGSGHVYDNGVFTASNRTALIEAGMHRLLQFDLVSTKVWSKSTYSGSYSTKYVWLLNKNYLVFQNNNRNDTGIPEPTTFGMLAAAGSMAAVCRRQRRNKNA